MVFFVRRIHMNTYTILQQTQKHVTSFTIIHLSEEKKRKPEKGHVSIQSFPFFSLILTGMVQKIGDMGRILPVLQHNLNIIPASLI